jgi:segregation and condensation protein B
MAEHLKPIIEALIFASPEPLPEKTLLKLLEGEPKEDVEAALALLKQDYDRPGGLQLVEVAGGYQIVTRPELHEYVRRLFHERTSQKLSVQPVTAPEISEIRGVNTSGVLNTLIERKLIKIVGRKAVVGKPFMYATTREFLDKFGLNDINDLPKVEDLADVLGFDPPSLDSEPTATPLAFDFDSSAEGGSMEAGTSDETSTEEATVDETGAAETDADEAAVDDAVDEEANVEDESVEDDSVEDEGVEEASGEESDALDTASIDADAEGEAEPDAEDDADREKLVRDGEPSS